MSTDLVQAPQYSLPDVREMANHVARSGLFPGIRTEEEAFTLMMLCQSEGLHPMQALRRFHIIDKRPSMRADAMLAEYQARGGRVRWVKTTATECEGQFWHPEAYPEPGLTVRYTIDDAKKAGLASRDSWQKNPADMLVARVISRGIRRVLPGVVVGIYTPDEIDSDERPGSARHEHAGHTSASRPAGLSSREAINATFSVAGSEPDEPSPESESWEQFVRRRCTRLATDWAAECEREGKRCPGNMAEPANPWQVSNALVTASIQSGATPEPEHRTNAWTHGEAQRLWESDARRVDRFVSNYLADKLTACRKALGMAVDTELVGVGAGGQAEPGEAG